MATRKGFNFYVSYYEVMETLSDTDTLQYIKALLNREFNGIEPDLSKMSRMARFAYTSQRHSIDSQIHGFEQKTKEPLTPIYVSTQGGDERVKNNPTPQEEGKEKEKEKEEVQLSINLNLGKHLFKNSPFYDKATFKNAFQEWSNEKLKFWYESAEDYSAQGHMYKDWSAAVRSWERKDSKNNTSRESGNAKAARSGLI